MRVEIEKLRDDRHAVRIVRDSGEVERVELASRSFLVHDLLHWATEREAGLGDGFWGQVAAGQPLDAVEVPGDSDIEKVVGALTSIAKGRPAADVFAGIERYAETSGWQTPGWLTRELVDAVAERMRRLLGRWRATPYGGVMELSWE